MNSSVSETVDLPEDLVISILERVHVKPLLRFKSVSKSWYNLITSPKFVTSHFQDQRNMLLVMRRSQRKELVFSFHDLDSPELEQVQPDSRISADVNPKFDFRIIGQYYGIVFLACNLDVIVCNPAFKEIKRLPPCPLPFDYKYVVTQWGFVSDANGFTIVQLQHRTLTQGDVVSSFIKAYLYNSATNSWRKSGRLYHVFTNFRLQDCDIFFNGACHWPISYPVLGEQHVLTMDVSSGVFGVLECPDWSKEQVKGSWLKVLDDRLAMVLFHECRKERVVEVWVMKEYGVKESWTKQFVMGPDRFVSPLLLLKNDQILMEDFYNELTSYQLRDKEIKKRHGVYGIRNSLQAIVYTESLFNLQKISGILDVEKYILPGNIFSRWWQSYKNWKSIRIMF